MTLDFRESGTVIVHMSDYVKNMLHDAPKDRNGTATTPTAAHLFMVNEHDPKCLPANKTEIYVHLVMQGLYRSQHGCPDMWTSLSFLCGWLVDPDWDDYKKLTRLIQYLWETLYKTLYMALVLCNNGSGEIC